MIRVIKRGVVVAFSTRCRNCSTDFEYDMIDLERLDVGLNVHCPVCRHWCEHHVAGTSRTTKETL